MHGEIIKWICLSLYFVAVSIIAFIAFVVSRYISILEKSERQKNKDKKDTDI